jgi:hypothetical protein
MLGRKEYSKSMSRAPVVELRGPGITFDSLLRGNSLVSAIGVWEGDLQANCLCITQVRNREEDDATWWNLVY